MSTDNNEDGKGLEKEVRDLERRVKYLEALLDNQNHDLFEQWFKDFLDDKCYGGW